MVIYCPIKLSHLTKRRGWLICIIWGPWSSYISCCMPRTRDTDGTRLNLVQSWSATSKLTSWLMNTFPLSQLLLLDGLVSQPSHNVWHPRTRTLFMKSKSHFLQVMNRHRQAAKKVFSWSFWNWRACSIYLKVKFPVFCISEWVYALLGQNCKLSQDNEWEKSSRRRTSSKHMWKKVLN